MKTNTFLDFVTPNETKDLSEIFEIIKSDKYESEISEIRYALITNKDVLAQNLKKRLPAFTPSGTFRDRRAINKLDIHNGIIHLDFDKLELDELPLIKEKINKCAYTFASFISPSGRGIKVFVKAEANKDNHSELYLKIEAFYCELLEIKTDESVKDVSRLCFFSYDPELFMNSESEIFPSDNDEENFIENKQLSLDFCKDYTEKKVSYSLGSRNKFIHRFSCNANRFGISEDETLEHCLQNYDLNPSEIKATVKSVYRNNKHEFAKTANIAKSANNEKANKEEPENEIKNVDELLKNTPTIPNSVYNNLPNFLYESCKVFDDPRERDVFLTSAIAIISGCLPELTGTYFNATIHPNLFAFILAPPASGKGTMKNAKNLGDKIHAALIQNSKEKLEQYKIDEREYRKRHQRNNKSSTVDADEKEPTKPPFKVLFIPANSSSSKVYEHLNDSDGKGIICETEADTLGTVFKNDWGSYSDLLRASFHNERVSLSRKTDNLFVEINNPQLSVILTGTPNQILNIIPSAEDGLFSRFIFYTFSTPPIWKSPAPQEGKPNLSNYFNEKAEEMLLIYEMLTMYPTEVFLTENQWDKFNQYFSSLLTETNEIVSAEATSVVKRQGLIVFRFCMIFTALRKFENGETTSKMYCSDTDFNSALELIKVYTEHTVMIYTNLPGNSKEFKIQKPPKKQAFFNALPEEFTRKEAVKIGISLKIPQRSIDYLLRETWLNTHIVATDTGKYRKVRL